MIDPAYEGGDLDVDPGDILTATAEAPAHQAGQLVVAPIFANQRPAPITLEHCYDYEYYYYSIIITIERKEK